MNAKELQDLIDFIAKSGLNKVDIETSDFKISVTRESSPKVKYAKEQPQLMNAPMSMPAAPQAAQMPQASASQPSAPAAAPAQESNAGQGNLITIKSPMIGTFYRSASPENPAFVNVGDEVKPGKVMCIIEAMKLFNEIECEVSGRIVKVLVDNASPVEYDQPLFLVEPA